MKRRLLASAFVALVAIAAAHAAQPIRALIITGGCCHDYPFQAQALMDGMKKFGDVTWTVVNEGGNGTRGQIALYDNPDWAKPYDVIVHNECFADTTDEAYIRKITAAHKAGKPAVVIHCAMHTYRAAKIDDWREFLGVTSRRHDHQSEYPVKPVLASHPIMRGFPAKWVTPMDELYIIEKLWPTARALATSVSEQDGKEYPTMWINDYHGTRVFGTTFGHGNATWKDPVFITVVARGILWAAGHE
jgi:type 1 glutamine amidotransferase